ncbi:MAG: HIT domain-containing protein [Chloroflexota bacterium]|nr:HIT domain-containing protein [Chloroflexota bacterium]
MEAKSCDSNGECVLCDKPRCPVEKDKENYILYRGEHCYIMLNLYPYTNGHMMIVPYLHEGDLTELDDDSLQGMSVLMRAAVAALSRLMQPTGFNIGMNLGRVAGAGIAEHLHMHVVPRWQGDTNFMSVLGDTRMIPEDLDITYDKLRPLLAEEVSK